MHIRFGNMSPEQFAELVGTEFTAPELEFLNSVRSGNAKLTGPDDFHIFDSPALSVTVGSASSRVLDIFKAAASRKMFNRVIDFDLDAEWGGN